jgi:hypothetical protein
MQECEVNVTETRDETDSVSSMRVCLVAAGYPPAPAAALRLHPVA